MTVNFWVQNGSRVEQAIVWKTDRLILRDMAEHTWIDARAVRLGFHVEVDSGSYSDEGEEWLLYDFVSGDLKTCGLGNHMCSALKDSANGQSK